MTNDERQKVAARIECEFNDMLGEAHGNLNAFRDKVAAMAQGGTA